MHPLSTGHCGTNEMFFKTYTGQDYSTLVSGFIFAVFNRHASYSHYHEIWQQYMHFPPLILKLCKYLKMK